MWKGAVVLISVLAVALAFQAISPIEPKPDKFKDQPGCYVSKLDQVIPFGETKSRADSEECVAYACNEHNIMISGCGSVAAQPPCTLFVEKNKPYPDCCPKIKCP